MDKNNLIIISRGLYKKEQILKESFKSGKITEKISGHEIIIPKLLFETSLELQIDQWYFNGYIINLKGKLIVVDPGVDFYSRFTSTGLSVNDIRVLIITHNHIDHTASLQIFLEKILKNKSKEITVFSSKDAFDTKVPDYYKTALSNAKHVTLNLLSDSQMVYNDKILSEYKISFLSLFHSCPDTFGFKLEVNKKIIGYVSDSGYAIKIKTDTGVFNSNETIGNLISIEEKHQYIADFFKNADLAVVNINALEYNKHSKYHLSGWDILDIFKKSQVKQVILQHISPINVDGEDSNYLFKLFFKDEEYQLILPHYLGRRIVI